MLPTKFLFIWPSGFREDFFRNQSIRNKNSLWWPCLLINRDERSNLYREPSKDAPYQVSIHLAKRFQRRRFFRNQPIMNGLWWPCLLTDRDEMSNLYRGPAINASYHVSVHLVKRFQRRRFLKIGQSETRIAMVAMFVDGSGQTEQSLDRTSHRCFLPSFTSFGWGVSEEKIKMWKVNGRRTPSDSKSSRYLWQGELKRGEG
jgi:hypothetical protein